VTTSNSVSDPGSDRPPGAVRPVRRSARAERLRAEMAALAEELAELTVPFRERTLRFMEVCGTHTVNACRSGVHGLVGSAVTLISGPGCPVCVTAQRYIDAAVDLGRDASVILATYGDMLRVTGRNGSLEAARSEGASVRVVTSALEAVRLAERHPDRQVVFAAVGFETTAPATAAAILEVRKRRLANFTVLPCHKRILPAMEALVSDPEVRIDGFLCPGHVSVVTGSELYRPLVDGHRIPCVVGGFEPFQIMEALVHLARQVVSGAPLLENLYPQVVTPEGNRVARALLERVFVPGDSAWRALGVIAGSGLDLRPEYQDLDAVVRFGVTLGEDRDPPGCRCGEVLTGRCRPGDCPLFAKACTPVRPIGPCMVSSEGACQAFFRYRRNERRREAVVS